MSVPVDNAKLTFKFALRLDTADTEIAEIGLWGYMSSPPTDSDSWNAALLAAATRAASSWGSNMTSINFTSHLRFGSVIATHYNPDGTTQYEQVVVHTPTWVGGGGAGLPWQCAQVVGLYSYTPGTFVSHQRRRRGRVYLPGISANILDSSGSGLLDRTKSQEQMSGFEGLCHDQLASPVVGTTVFHPAVFSRVAGALYPITDLTTDAKVDTQRRRTHQFSVTRDTVPLAGP